MKIAICDDDKNICDILASRIKREFPEVDILVFESAEKLFEEERFPDILLLDIGFHGMNGMEAARKMRDRGFTGILIFITGEEEHVFDAFDVQAFHYLVKPVSEKKLKEVLCAAITQQTTTVERNKKDNMEQMITVYSSGMHRNIHFKDVVYAEVYDRKMFVHTTKEDIEYYGRLSDFAESAGRDFYRTHRSFLIHFKYVESYDRTKVILEGGREVPLSRRHYGDFIEKYMEYGIRQRKRR